MVLYFEITNDDICGSRHARDFEMVIGDVCNSMFSLDLEKVNDILCVLISAPYSEKGIDEVCNSTFVLEEKANDVACESTWALDLKKAHELEDHQLGLEVASSEFPSAANVFEILRLLVQDSLYAHEHIGHRLPRPMFRSFRHGEVVWVIWVMEKGFSKRLLTAVGSYAIPSGASSPTTVGIFGVDPHWCWTGCSISTTLKISSW